MTRPGTLKNRLAHVPALDGLRGLALLGVLFFHAQGVLAGGFLGVDLFFVLSGFLITSLLLAEHERAGRIDLGAFWARRARRLFPALLSLMPAIALYCWAIAKPDELADLRAQALATLAYVANWRAIYAHKSYWELFASPSPLEHTWSLAIEEQFYVVWPLLIAFVMWRAKKNAVRAVAIVSSVLCVASMIAMFVLSNAETTTRAYMGTDTRAAAILAGAILATIASPGATFSARTTRIFDALGAFAAAGLAFAWVRLDGSSSFLYRGGFWLTEACGCVLVVCAISGGVVSRVLAFAPLVWLGTISYGAYLWHWPVDVVLTAERTHVHGPKLFAMQLAITFVISIVSYRFLERPIRARGLPFGRPMIVVPVVVALAVVLVVRATYARKPIAVALPSELPPSALDASSDAGPPFRIVVFGDSTANSLGWGLRGVRDPNVAIDLRGKDSCTMLWDTCGGETWQPLTTELHPNASLIFFGGAFLHGIDADGRWRQACYRTWDERFESTVEKRLAGLSTPDTRAFLVTVPYPLGPYDSAPWREKVDCINRSIRTAAKAVPEIALLDLAERLCPHGECEREYGGFTIRPDGVHYDIDGVRAVSQWVLDEIRR